MRWVSDAIAALLGRIGLKYLSLNPGASFRGLQESVVNYMGNEDPQLLLCLHEEHAAALAHGYAKVTGEPMGVLLHSNVGLMHASMAIFNAWCDRVPILIIGGTGPVDAARRRPWIDWIHTAVDQGALVRHFSKWDDQPASVEAAMESLLRGSLLSRTSPCGPVYICLDSAMQETELGPAFSLPDPGRFRPPSQAAPSSEVIRAAAELIQKAENPVILPGRVSRRMEDWERRVLLAEASGAKVITDLKAGAAFPTSHPSHVAGPGLFLSEKAISILREADLIISLDWIDLAGSLKQVWGAQPARAKVIHCSLDSYVHRGWSMDYQGLPPADLPILADPDVFTSSLLDVLPASQKRSMNQRERSVSAQERGLGDGPISLLDLGRCLRTVLGKEKSCLIRLPLGWPSEVCDFREPLDYLGGDGGGGIGSGPGMAVGAALALKGSERLPIAILGDGDYLMGVSSLWTAAHYRLPLLIIVANNRSFRNSESHQRRVAEYRGRPKENGWIGQRIDDPPPDLAGLASAQGIEGEGPVEDTRDLLPALKRGVEAVRGGNGYVVDVLVGAGDRNG